MMRVTRFRAVWLTLLVSMVVLFGGSPVEADNHCNARSRLHEGLVAVVTPGSANNVRSAPSLSAEKIGEIPGDGAVMVLESLPDNDCPDGYVWWKVDYDGLIGWTVEIEADNPDADRWLINVFDYEYRYLELESEPETLSSLEEPARFYGVVVNAPLDEITATYHLPNAGTDCNPNPSPGYVSLRTSFGRVTVRPSAGVETISPGALDRLLSELNQEVEPAGSRAIFSVCLMWVTFLTRVEYHDMGWGTAYSFLTHRVHGDNGWYRGTLFYNVIGLTHDERLIVNLETQLQGPVPDEVRTILNTWDLRSEEVDDLRFATDRQLATQTRDLSLPMIETADPNTGFAPSLTEINDFARSLSFEPDALAGEENIPRYITMVLNNDTVFGPDQPSATAVVPTDVPPPDHCGIGFVSNVKVGDIAIQAMNTDPVRVRDDAGGEYAGFDVPPQTLVEVMAGPRCASINDTEYVWWEVRMIDGQRGWVVEGTKEQYFFEPF